MKIVVSILVACFGFAQWSYGQSSADKLKKEQNRLEKKIKNTKSLLDKTKTNTEKSMNELRLIETQKF